jgi:hypothetical protein
VAYAVDSLTPLYQDSRGMLLKPKKKKEYRYSKDLNVLHESLSPISSTKMSLAGSTRSYKGSEV